MRLYVVLTKLDSYACVYTIRAKNSEDAVAKLRQMGTMGGEERVLDVGPAVSASCPEAHPLRLFANLH